MARNLDWRGIAAVGAAALAGVATPQPAHAQQPPRLLAQQTNPNLQGQVREQTQNQQRVQGTGSAAAAAAVQKREQEGVRAVTFEDVLKDPDNVELNFDYARTLVAQGDLKGAASTLERMLLNYPDLAQVRLFYAIVLYRLDSLDEAERELLTVSQLDMPDSLRQEIQSYLDRIAFRKKSTRYSASLSFGTAYDSNRNAAPRSGQVLFLDIPIPVADAAREHSDKALLSVGSFRVRHDLGYQEKHEVFGGLTIFRSDQLHLNEQNLQSYVFDAGGTYRSDWVDVTINPTWTKLRLADQSYYDSYGGKFRLDKKVDQSFDVYSEYAGVYEKFRGITFSPSSVDRTGGRHDIRTGVTWTLMPTLQLNFEADYTRKNARQSYVAYSGYALQGNLTYLMDGGQFLLLTAMGERDQYDDPDQFVSARTRQDTIMRFRGTYGAPLGFFSDLVTGDKEALPSFIADITFTGALEWLDSASNLPNYDYSNLKAQFLLTKRWEF
ncbi:MAG: tetratricopeptide repeat protein [Alphaproteobacteria bacterium]|nr:tetratricopeptide repeat protein [Alphaproteobacteria bacterium]